jgi:hypothetical protein
VSDQLDLAIEPSEQSDSGCSVRESKRHAGPEPWYRWVMGDTTCKPWDPPTTRHGGLVLCEKHLAEAKQVGMQELRRRYRIT